MAERGRKRKPVDLEGRGRIHRPAAEIEARRANERAIIENLDDATPPDYFTGSEKIKRFNEVAALLKQMSAFLGKSTDSDAIAAYVDAQMNYEANQAQLEALRSDPEASIASIERVEKMRNASQVQCDRLRAVLYLDPSARLKIDKTDEAEEKVNKFKAL